MVVFVHGCGGVAQTEATWIDTYIDNASDYLLMAPGLGRDGQCWDSDADAAPLLAAIADAKTHFNVDPKRVVVGGYSSGFGARRPGGLRQRGAVRRALRAPGPARGGATTTATR